MTTTSVAVLWRNQTEKTKIGPPEVSTSVDAFGEPQLTNTMSYKPVSTAQTENLRKVANDKKVGRALFQQALDDGSFARLLDSLKSDEEMEYIPLTDDRIAELTQKAASVGARIHVLRRVRIQQDLEWQEAVNLAGPNTPDHYNVRKGEVSGQYPPVSKKVVEKDIVLLNYSNGDGNWDKTLMWCKDMSLKGTNPREVFAISEQHPTLHNTLGQNPMYVFAPTECAFESSRRACYVWWNDSEREADLVWVSDFGNSYGWFALTE